MRTGSRFLLLFLFLAASFGFESAPRAKADPAQGVDTSLPPLRIAFIPSTNPDQMLDDVRPVVAYFERELGRPVRPYVMIDYSAAVEALRGGHADVSFMSPLPYVMAHQMGAADALLGEVYRGRTTLQGHNLRSARQRNPHARRPSRQDHRLRRPHLLVRLHVPGGHFPSRRPAPAR